MSSNYPPGYVDPNKSLYPQGRNDPAPPSNVFPSYGGPQPNAIYPSGPNAHLYPGPGWHPPGPYPEQPHASGPKPPMMSPVIPAVLESGNADGFSASDDGWGTVNLRHAFIRKVYMILAAQLLFTTGIVAVFTFVDSVKIFVQQNQALFWASFAVYFITYLVVVCYTVPRRKHPWNMILLFVLTLDLSYQIGAISSFYNTKAVFLALGITAIVCIVVTVFCFQTKSSQNRPCCVPGIVMFVVGIVTVIVLSLKYIYWLHMLYAALGAIVYTIELAYHTQLLIGSRMYSIGPEEYIFAMWM